MSSREFHAADHMYWGTDEPGICDNVTWETRQVKRNKDLCGSNVQDVSTTATVMSKPQSSTFPPSKPHTIVLYKMRPSAVKPNKTATHLQMVRIVPCGHSRTMVTAMLSRADLQGPLSKPFDWVDEMKLTKGI